jgi:RimJ/RimL family protein N-acetyltransferase
MGVLIEVVLMQVDIRPFKLSDAGELQRAVLNSVGHIGPWLDWCTPSYVLKDAQDWVAESMALWQQGRAFRWVMLAEDKQQILGSVEVEVPTLEAPVGRMGYWVRHNATGKGVCSQGAAQALDWAFKSLGLQRVELFIQPANQASIRVALKLGAEFLDEQNNEIVYRGESRLSNRYVVKPEGLPWVDLLPARRGWPLTPEYAEGTGDRLPVHPKNIYEFRSSAKKA